MLAEPITQDGLRRVDVDVLAAQQCPDPPGAGDGSFQVTVDASDILELSRRLLRAFGLRGFAGVEFKRHPRDGAFRLIEINARTESGNQLAISAGVDLPWIGYRYLTGEGLPTEPIRPSRQVKYVNEEWDVQSFAMGSFTACAFSRT